MNFNYETILDGFDDAVARKPKAPCVTFMGKTTDYEHMQLYAKRFAVYLIRLGIRPGDRVMIVAPPCREWIIAYLGYFYAGAVPAPYSPEAPKLELAEKILEYGAANIATLDLFYPTVKEAFSEQPLKWSNPLRSVPIVANIPEMLSGTEWCFSGTAPEFLHTSVSSLFCAVSALKFGRDLEIAEEEKAYADVIGLSLAKAEKKIARLERKVTLFEKARKALREDAGNFHSFGKIIHGYVSQEEIDALDERRPLPSSLGHIMSTGGTSGGQKGVMFSHKKIADNANRCLEHFSIKRGVETFFLSLPPDHAFPDTVAINAPLISGSHIVIEIDPRDIAAIRNGLVKSKATVFVGVPAQYEALSETERCQEGLENLKYCISGGSALAPAIEERFNAWVGRAVLFGGYGFTEGGPVVTCNKPGRNKPGSIGSPLPGISIRYMKEEGGHFRETAQGEIGWMWVRTPSVMDGYWNNPEATAKVLTKDGKIQTADLGYEDEDGNHYCTGRKDDVIVGKNKKYPDDIEAKLKLHKAVAEVSVVGIPPKDVHESSEPEVWAFVVLKDGYTQTEALKEELKDWVAAHMAPYNIPKEIRFKTEIPKSRKESTLRYLLRMEAMEERTAVLAEAE